MKKLLILLVVLASLSWGACETGSFFGGSCGGVGNQNIGYWSQPSCTGNFCEIASMPSVGTCAGTGAYGGYYYGGYYEFTRQCMNLSSSQTNSCGRVYAYNNAIYRFHFRCSTKAEADSAYCALNPSADGCIQEIDTTLFACSDSYSGNGALYRLACRAQNGTVVSCNGKTNITIWEDGTKIRDLNGTCAQNGFESGIIGGASADTSSPQSANADCFAVIGSKCHMKDKVSGNTFSCDCDGSCNVALRNLMAGNANCQNPYPQPSSSDGALSLPFQSSSSASSSPSSEGGSSGGTSEGTSSGDGTSSSSDFEYDYTEVLDNIRANTQYNGTVLDGIRNNTETANSLLQAIVNKDWNPTINVAAPNVNVSVETDTAHAPAEILSYLKDTTGIGGYAEQFSNERDEAIRRGDSLLSATSSFIDSLEGSFPNLDYSDSIGSAVQGVNSALATLKDTIDNSAISDSMTRWEGLITDNGVITGDGSNDCPSILTQTYTWEFPIGNSQVNVNVPALGQYLCTPITGINITLWALARVLLRAIVAIGCMIWIYKAVMGIDESGEGE